MVLDPSVRDFYFQAELEPLVEARQLVGELPLCNYSIFAEALHCRAALGSLKESLPGAFSRFALKSTAGVERQICSRQPIGMFSAVYRSTAVLRLTQHAAQLQHRFG